MAMRRVSSSAVKSTPTVARRGISGVAPVLHFPSAAKGSKADQVAHNTAVAVEMLKAQLGEKPAPYTRKYTQTIGEIQTEIEDTLKSCGGGEGGELEDGKELTPLQVVERVLQHGLWSYQKNAGSTDYDQMEKWLVYTAKDQQSFSALKRDNENAEKYAAFKKDSPGACLPAWNWEEEYAATSDREIVAEKRKRYDTIAATVFEKDEKAIQSLLQEYKAPEQEKALDTMVEQLTMFKPFLAKQIIQEKLIERNADNQLSFSRWVDWNPDARDMAELEWEVGTKFYGDSDYLMAQTMSFAESYKRYADVRMRTKEEVLAKMDSTQAGQSSGAEAAGAGDAARAAMIAEIVKLQTRGAKADDEPAEDGKEEDPEAKAAAQEAAKERAQKEAERYKVSDDAVKSKGLIGLTFLSAAEASA